MYRLPLRLLPLWLLFILPLAVLTAGNDYVIQPKWTVAMIGGALIASAAAMSGWRGLRRHPLFVPVMALLVATTVSALFAIDLPQAGRVTLQRIALGVVCLAVAMSGISFGRVLVVSAASVLIQAWVAWEQARGNWIVGHGEQFGAGRIYATLGNPSFFGVYLAPVAVWFGYRVATAAADRRPAALAGSSATLAVILVLMSRAAVIDAWAGLGVGAAVIAWLVASRGRMPSVKVGLASVAVLLIGAAATLAVLAPRLGDRLDYLRVKAFSWHAAAWMWRDAPVLGAGPGEYQTRSPFAMTNVWNLWTNAWGVRRNLVAPHDEAFAHQDYLQILAEQGTVGLGLMIWIAVIAIRIGLARIRSGDRDKVGWLAGLSAFLPTMALHFPLWMAPSAMIFWISIGALGARPERPVADRSTASGRIGIFMSLPLLFLLSVFLCRSLTTNVLLGEGYRLFRGASQPSVDPELRRRAFDLAAWHLGRFEALDPRSYEERFYAGVLHQARGDDAAAIDGYTRAIALYPGMQGAIYNLGNLHFRRENWAVAADTYAKVLALNPASMEAANNIGNAVGMQGKYDEADRWYRKALQMDPAYPDALYNLCVNAWRRRDRAAAKRWLEKALAADPGYAPAREFAPTLGVRVPRR